MKLSSLLALLLFDVKREGGGYNYTGGQLQIMWVEEISYLLNSCQFTIEIFTCRAAVQVFF